MIRPLGVRPSGSHSHCRGDLQRAITRSTWQRRFPPPLSNGNNPMLHAKQLHFWVCLFRFA